MIETPWKLNPYECFEAPAVTALFYHNAYEEGKQGGFELIQRGVRLAGNGNLRLGPALIRPNYPELLDPFPFLWMQKEYVISGAATYIFCVLAAQDILKSSEQGA